MNIGVPKEAASEYRVGLSPDGAGILCADGHQVYIESKAGEMSGFGDEDYRAAGALVVYSADEAWGRADLVAKVRAPVAGEYSFLRRGLIISGFLHLAVAPRALVRALLDNGVAAIAYETIRDDSGELPVVTPMSELAGRMIPLVAGQLLMNTLGGKGILLGGLPGIPSADVAIVGAGTVGYNAAKVLLGLGAQVTVLDHDPARLRDVDARLGGHVNLMLASPANLKKVCGFADVLVGAVLVPGERAPRLITREMVRSMKSRAVIMDMSIDQGGCVETSRPTTLEDPVYVEEDVIHYCVPNMPAMVARTASQVMTYSVLPFIEAIAVDGLKVAVSKDKTLARGLVVANGRVLSPAVANAVGAPVSTLKSAFKVEEA